MSNAMEKIGKMIRDAGDGTPATVKPDYKKVASPHTYAEPEVVFNEHIKQAKDDITKDELELLFLKQAEAEAGAKDEDPVEAIKKAAETSVMDSYDSQAIINAVNSAGSLDEKLKAYTSASKADKVAPSVEPGKSEGKSCH